MQKSAGVGQWVRAKKQRDGGQGKRAVIGVMRRLALAAYQVGANGVAFDAERLFNGSRPASSFLADLTGVKQPNCDRLTLQKVINGGNAKG